MKNWLIVAAWVFLLMWAFNVTSHAAELGIRGGAGLVENDPTGAVKIFAIREESSISKYFYDAKEVGGWVDNMGNGRKSSYYGKYALGVKPGPKVGFYGKAFVGIAALSDIDNQLGGHAQFSEDFGVGIRDDSTFMELIYTHFSSAGIFTPNHGRDFMILGAGVRW